MADKGPIINGRRINPNAIPDAGVYGREIIDKMGTRPGRRPIIEKGPTAFEQVEPNRRYTKQDLLDRKGNPVKVDDIPDRTKGATFGAPRSSLSKQIITEQVYDIAQNNFKNGVDFDEDNADWMVVPNYWLPRRWHSIAAETPLLIAFPTEYPQLPPIGFYMKATIPVSVNGHFFEIAYHEAWQKPLQDNLGWKWYCVFIRPEDWQPAPVRRAGDWKRGDNIWTYFRMISEVLGSTD